LCFPWQTVIQILEMKNTILRILISATLFSLISGLIVSIAGLILGWKTSTQFSDGFFWAGAIMISLGVLNIMGGRNQPPSGLQTRQSVIEMGMDERFKLWAADTLHGYNILAFLGISGLLLLGMAGLVILIGRLF
jgi:hypothetical protein